MKRIFLLMIAIVIANNSFAQTNIFPASGNVGIGTTSPGTVLEVRQPVLSGGDVSRNLTLFTDLYNNGSNGQHLILTSLANGINFTGWNLSSDWRGRLSFGVFTNSFSTIPNEYLTIVDGGNIGIGTTNPADKLDIIAPNNGLSILSNSPSSYPYIKLGRTSADATIAVPGTEDEWAVGASSGDFVLRTESTANKIFINNGSLLTGLVIDNNNVLIGKTTQTNSSYKLDVNGNIRANQVTVNATGADYVFDPHYKLPSLDSLSDYIKTHHHLPGIPSAKEIQKNGMNVGEAYTKLLQKMEETTRYMIEQQQIIDNQSKEIKKLNKQMRIIQRKEKS